ncbi:MAG: HAMP domain-containing sensor histidine kinase [Oscillospiraceae bacterium]
MKKRGLLKKLYLRYAFTILICTVILGASMMGLCVQYFGQSIKNDLGISARLGASTMAEELSDTGGLYVLSDEIESKFAVIGSASENTVFFCDTEGTVKLCSDLGNCVHKEKGVPQSALSRIVSDGYVSGQGMLNEEFTGGPQYFYGVPLVIDDTLYGFVFAMAPVRVLYGFMAKIGVIYLISVCAMLLIASCIVYAETKNLVKPLTEMQAAAKALSEGDFTVRVTETDADDEIGDLARSFNKMADSLRDLEESRSSFVANVSHELRTPMTTIGGYIDGILDGTIPKDQQEHYLKIVLSEVKRLSRLTTELLNLSKIEAGEREPNIVVHNVWDTIVNVMLSCEQRISEKSIHVPDFNADEPAYVMCDPDMFHQVIYNLVDNAIKFTPEKGEIKVTVNPMEETTSIEIRNTGAGIAPEDLGRIFDRFYKGDKSRAMDRTGTGLGLYIVKKLVNIMNGKIYAASTQGEYAAFTVILQNPKKEEESGGRDGQKPLLKRRKGQGQEQHR